MIIHVGSQNQTKIDGVRNVAIKSVFLKDAQIIGVDAAVEEFGHPKSLAETIEGAKNRAVAVKEGADLSVGLESGLFESEDAAYGYFETTACAVYDGSNYHIGLGPAFEWPEEMLKLILNGKDGSQAFKTLGLTSHDKIGTAEGAIHVLTHGRINRTLLNELAFNMALLQLENSNLYH